MDNVADVYDMAETVLQTIREVYAENGTTLPNRQYVIVGATAHDCEQVTVSFMVLSDGLPNSSNGRTSAGACINPTNGTFLIEVVRDLPPVSGGRNGASVVPTAIAITNTARTQMIDARLLSEVAHRMMQDSIFPGAGAYSIAAGAPSGLRQAMQMELNIAV